MANKKTGCKLQPVSADFGGIVRPPELWRAQLRRQPSFSTNPAYKNVEAESVGRFQPARESLTPVAQDSEPATPGELLNLVARDSELVPLDELLTPVVVSSAPEPHYRQVPSSAPSRNPST